MDGDAAQVELVMPKQERTREQTVPPYREGAAEREARARDRGLRGRRAHAFRCREASSERQMGRSDRESDATYLQKARERLSARAI